MEIEIETEIETEIEAAVKAGTEISVKLNESGANIVDACARIAEKFTKLAESETSARSVLRNLRVVSAAVDLVNKIKLPVKKPKKPQNVGLLFLRQLEDNRILRSQCYIQYKNYAESRGVAPISKSEFFRLVEKSNIYKTKTISGQHCFYRPFPVRRIIKS